MKKLMKQMRAVFNLSLKKPDENKPKIEEQNSSLEKYSNLLRAFFNQETRKTLMIKGRWGVGKTHFYKTTTSRYKADKKDLRPFCYISLFGLASIDEVKAKIISSAGLIRGSAAIVKDSLNDILKDISPISISIPQVALNSLENKLLNNCVVCIDDLERKHPDISLETIFGLADRLTSQNSCQVVFIVNDDELKNEIDALRKHRDKVIDLEIHFSPTLNENLDIVFSSTLDPKLVKRIHDILERFEKSNIRTIKRIKWMMDEFQFLISECEEYLKLQIVEQITSLSVMHYEFGEALDSEKLANAHWMAMKIAENIDHKYTKSLEGDPKDNDSLKQLIYKSKFIAHELDPLFISYLQDGYIERERAMSAIAQWRESVARQQLRERMEKVNNLIWGGFGFTQEQVIEEIKKLIDEHLLDFYVEQYNNYVLFIMSLGVQIDRSEWDKKFALHIIEYGTYAELETLRILPLDQIVKQKIQDRIQLLLKEHSISELVIRLSRNDAYDSNDLRYLNAYSEMELKEYFVSSENLDSCTELSILAGHLNDSGAISQKELANKFKNIVMTFSERSELDKRRTQKTHQKIDSFLAMVLQTSQFRS